MFTLRVSIYEVSGLKSEVWQEEGKGKGNGEVREEKEEKMKKKEK